MLSSRSAVRRLFEEKTVDLDEINLPLIADEVVAEVKENPELLAAFVDEHLRPMVYDVGFAVLSDQRATQRRIEAARAAVSAVVLPASSPPVRVHGQLLAPRRTAAGLEWLRQPLSVARGRQVRLEAARRPEVRLARERQQGRVVPARIREMHLRLIEETLPDDEQTVGDVLDDAAIGTLYEHARERIAAEDRANALVQQAVSTRRKQPALPSPE